MTDTVAATAVRMACVIEGRFFSAQAQTFMRTASFQRTMFGKIFAWLDESNRRNEVSSKDRAPGSYWSANSSLSSVKSFDLAVDPDVLLCRPLSKVAGTAPS